MELVRYIDYMCDFYGKHFLVIIIFIFLPTSKMLQSTLYTIYTKRRKDHLQVAKVVIIKSPDF